MLQSSFLYTELPTPEEMRGWDAAAAGVHGISPSVLMENAGRAAFNVLAEQFPLHAKPRVLIFMGGGNNGGDGAVLARCLHDAGCPVLVCHTRPLEEMPSPAKEHAFSAQSTGVDFLYLGQQVPSLLLPFEWRFAEVVVDAVTGTGIKGDLRDKELALVRYMNSRADAAFIFALDSPTGLCGYTGKPRPEAVRARATVAFEAAKPGLCFPEALEYTGNLFVRPIGIPAIVRTAHPASWRIIAPRPGAWALLSPLRHKGNSGTVLVVGGSGIYSGAPVLAALGALRGGAGLAHVAVPAALALEAKAGFPEILVHPLGKGSEWTEKHADELKRLLKQLSPDAVVVGPGLGREAGAREAVRSVLQACPKTPVVVDADALHFFRLPDVLPLQGAEDAEEKLDLSLLTEHHVLTPHPGEMARLLPCSYFAARKRINKAQAFRECVAELQEDRTAVVRAFTRACSAVLLLKGAGSITGRRGKPSVLVPNAAPVLAVGGSGDVLAGLCASLAAQGFTPWDAAALGAWMHVRAGIRLGENGTRGFLAREIADEFPKVWEELCRC